MAARLLHFLDQRVFIFRHRFDRLLNLLQPVQLPAGKRQDAWGCVPHDSGCGTGRGHHI